MRISFDLDDKLICYVEPAMLCQSPVEIRAKWISVAMAS